MSHLKSLHARRRCTMVRIKGINDAERKRRTAQSKRDKSKKAPVKTAAKRSSKSARGSTGGGRRKLTSGTGPLHPYTKLVLDPCKAELTKTPLPGREGCSLFRLPFRFVVSLNTGSANITGSAVSNTPSSNILVALAPSAMNATATAAGGIAAVSASTNINESSGPRTDAAIMGGTVAADCYLNTDPVGLGQLNAITSMCRPVAGCVKLEYYSGTANTGSFFGYEGVAGDLYRRYNGGGSTPQALVPNTSGNNIAMLGWSSGITTEGVEAAVNYAAAVPEWQEFKQLGNITPSGSADAADPDISNMPLAIVGVGGGTPGTQYLVSGAIVYEWTPSINFGISAAGVTRPAVRDEKTLDLVVKQLAKYGPMLVGVASKLVTGGPTLAIADMMYKLSLTRNNTSSGGSGAIGWK